MQTLQERDMKKSSRTTPGWRVALHCLSVKVLAVPLLLQQRAHLQDQDSACPSLVQSRAVSAGAALLDQWWGWAAPEDSCFGEHTPREYVVSPSVFWQKSYCFTCIPGAWNRRGRGEKCVPAVISDAANFCLLSVASVDHDLISSNVLDHWSFTQAGKRWEGSLGTDLEDLWHRICVQHTSNQIKNSKARAVGSRNGINATKCQCLHFLVSLSSLTPWNVGVCPALRFCTKWIISAGSVRGLCFLPRGRKVKVLGRELVDTQAWHFYVLNCRNFLRLEQNSCCWTNPFKCSWCCISQYPPSCTSSSVFCLVNLSHVSKRWDTESNRAEEGTPCQWQPILISSCKVLSRCGSPITPLLCHTFQSFCISTGKCPKSRTSLKYVDHYCFLFPWKCCEQ